MKEYKDYDKIYIGQSDYAALILVGFRENRIKTEPLKFFEDGAYMAYFVTESKVNIGSHYKKVSTFSHWLKIYDDAGLAYKITAREINIYRAGMFGCIIQAIQ